MNTSTRPARCQPPAVEKLGISCAGLLLPHHKLRLKRSTHQSPETAGAPRWTHARPPRCGRANHWPAHPGWKGGSAPAHEGIPPSKFRHAPVRSGWQSAATGQAMKASNIGIQTTRPAACTSPASLGIRTEVWGTCSHMLEEPTTQGVRLCQSST